MSASSSRSNRFFDENNEEECDPTSQTDTSVPNINFQESPKDQEISKPWKKKQSSKDKPVLYKNKGKNVIAEASTMKASSPPPPPGSLGSLNSNLPSTYSGKNGDNANDAELLAELK